LDSPSHTVLVVDDDPSIRFLCRVNLELDGWAVREAGTLDEARGELLEGDVGVVLLDVHVGTQSGIDYLDELRRDHPDVSVAMLTGSVGTPTLEGTRPDGVLAKPFTLEQLAETVRRLAPRTAHSAG
jgi:DNA-binding NtrC family response regulator